MQYLEVNAEKPQYMLMCRHQNAGQNYNMKTANRFFEMWQNSEIWELQQQTKFGSLVSTQPMKFGQCLLQFGIKHLAFGARVA
jgi:hypothetical protein